MKLAVVTCKHYPQGVKEDSPLFEALEQQNIEYHIHAWDAEIDWSFYDACLLRSVWDYHQRTTEFNNWLTTTAQQTQIINNPEVVLWNQNKKYLAELAEFGITIAPTDWLNKDQSFDLQQLLDNRAASSYFLKPVIGANSLDTLRFNNNPAGIEQAQTHLASLLVHQDMMLQPYLSTVETFGETSAIYFSGDYSHAVRKIPVTGEHRVQETFGAKDISYDLNPAELSLSKACLQFLSDKFGEILYARFDFLHGEDGTVYLNEAELIEPSLFFQHDKTAAMKMVQAIQNHISKDTPE